MTIDGTYAKFRDNPNMLFEMIRNYDHLKEENAKLRELFDVTYGYYISGTLAQCDICDRYGCEGPAPTSCKLDEYDPDGIVRAKIEGLMQELGIEA